MCTDTAFDAQYSWGQALKNGRHYFRGYTTSEIYFDPERSLWQMSLYSEGGGSSGSNLTTFAVTNATGNNYPFGTHSWEISGDGACGGGVDKKNSSLLSFTSCSRDEFNCKNGYCIDMGKRCDRRVDCPDKSGIAKQGLFKKRNYATDLRR